MCLERFLAWAERRYTQGWRTLDCERRALPGEPWWGCWCPLEASMRIAAAEMARWALPRGPTMSPTMLRSRSLPRGGAGARAPLCQLPGRPGRMAPGKGRLVVRPRTCFTPWRTPSSRPTCRPRSCLRLSAWGPYLSLDPATIVDESRSGAESGGSAAAPVGWAPRVGRGPAWRRRSGRPSPRAAPDPGSAPPAALRARRRRGSFAHLDWQEGPVLRLVLDLDPAFEESRPSREELEEEESGAAGPPPARPCRSSKSWSAWAWRSGGGR